MRAIKAKEAISCNYVYFISTVSLFTLVFSGVANATSARDCAGFGGTTGYALEITRGSGVNASSVAIGPMDGIQVRPGTGTVSLSCTPVDGELEQVGTDGNVARMDYEVGSGFSISTGVIAPPLELDAYSPRSRFQGTLYLPFRLSTASGTPENVDITFNTQYVFTPIITQVQAPGTAGNGLTVFHDIGFFRNPSGFDSQDSWSSSAANPPGTGNKLSESSHVVSLTANNGRLDPFIFKTDINIVSDARSTLGAADPNNPAGSGLASIGAALTFAVDVPEGVELLFDYEELLGLAAPSLGAVTPAVVPLPPAVLLFAGALATLFMRNSRTPKRQNSI